MKKVMSFLVLLTVVCTTVCSAAIVYPEYSTPNKNQAQITERVNIVFDNSGHEYVKEMLIDVCLSAVVAENTDVWVYPISGSNQPVKLVADKSFIEDNFNLYTKSSNEFKTENVVDKALNDLVNDTTVTKKRLILYADGDTEQLRNEYDLYDWHEPYIEKHPDIIFSSCYSFGKMLSNNSYNNFETLYEKSLYEFFLVKNGYALCESTYDKQNGVIKLEKGKANNNLFVIVNNIRTFGQSSYEKNADVYLSGCALDTDAYNEYKQKSKVKGVALSYNHIVADDKDDNTTFASALYTLDGDTINPETDDVYIPVINANTCIVYHKETKGAGVCSSETTYDCSQDKAIVNVKAPKTETQSATKEVSQEQTIDPLENFRTKTKNETSSKDNVFLKILSIILSVIGTILAVAFRLIRILIFVFIVLLIVNRKFRCYVQLKIIATKYGPTYEKIIVKIKTMIKDILGAGVKIKGNPDLQGKYIFISKASADMISGTNRVSLVVSELEKRNIKCWTSETGIKPGQDYNVVLPEAIRKCALFLVFVSPMSVKSSEVITEISTAKEHKKTIIPIQIEPFDLFKDFPNWAYMLKQYQKTDLFNSKPEEIKTLANYIEQMLNDVK